MIDNANMRIMATYLHRAGNHQGGSKTSPDHLPINNHRWRIWNIVDYLVKEFKRGLNIFCNIISRSKMTVRESACRICLKNMLFAMIGCCKFCTNWNAASSTKTVEKQSMKWKYSAPSIFSLLSGCLYTIILGKLMYWCQKVFCGELFCQKFAFHKIVQCNTCTSIKLRDISRAMDQFMPKLSYNCTKIVHCAGIYLWICDEGRIWEWGLTNDV